MGDQRDRTTFLSRREAVRLTGVGLAGLGLGTLASKRPEPAGAQSSPSIVGVWLSNVSRPDGTKIMSLLLFTSDGTMIRTSTQALTQSPAFGAWSQQDDGYVFSYQLFGFDAAGNYLGASQTRAQAALSPDGSSFTTAFVIDTLDAQDNIVQTTPVGTSQATRLQVQSM